MEIIDVEAPLYKISIIGYGVSETFQDLLYESFDGKIEKANIQAERAPACVPEFVVDFIIGFSAGVTANTMTDALKEGLANVKKAVKKARTSEFDELLKNVQIEQPGCTTRIVGNLGLDDYNLLIDKVMSFVNENSSKNPVCRVELPCVKLGVEFNSPSLYTVFMTSDGAMPGEENYNLWSVSYCDNPTEKLLFDYANGTHFDGEVVDFLEYTRAQHEKTKKADVE